MKISYALLIPLSWSSTSSTSVRPTIWVFPMASTISWTTFAPLVTTASTYPSLIKSVKISLIPLGTKGPDRLRNTV